MIKKASVADIINIRHMFEMLPQISFSHLCNQENLLLISKFDNLLV